VIKSVLYKTYVFESDHMQKREQVFIGGKWNNAFGGVKDSGIDNEESKDGLEEYLNIKYSLIG
jgi:hypothetical protein